MYEPVESEHECYDEEFDGEDTDGDDDLSEDPHFGAGVGGG